MPTHHHPKKRFGQNFLWDESIIDQILSVVAPKATDHLVEIGPGLGALTLPLLALVGRLSAIELDRDIIPILIKKTAGMGQLEIYQEDVLQFDFKRLGLKDNALRIIGNLPYNISTPLIFHLLTQKHLIKDMHFMLQREVAKRLTANPGGKQYGRLSVMTQYHCKMEALIDVPASAFDPAPQVESMFIRLVPLEVPSHAAKDLGVFNTIVRVAFSQRRKTLGNALKGLVTREGLLALHIDPTQRPEELSVDNFVKISNIVTVHGP